MKKYRVSYYYNGRENNCEMFGDSIEDIKKQFNTQSYFRDCQLTFVGLPDDDTERQMMLRSISSIIRAKNFSLN